MIAPSASELGDSTLLGLPSDLESSRRLCYSCGAFLLLAESYGLALELAMFCTQCGAQTDESDKFCPQCGTARAPLPPKGHNWLLWIAGGSIGLLCLLLVIGSVRSTQHLDEVVGETAPKQGATEEGEATSATPQKSEPPSADVVLHAYDVLKNPYGYKNRLVVLDVMERPVLFNGSLFQYAGGVDPRVATSLGMAGVRFDRMLTENTAVYDVMALDANNNSDPELIGQLAVLLPSGRGQLELGPDWEVEPLGTVEGTNGFGARMQVPEVRFWRYHGEQQRTPPTPPTSVLSGDGRTAVELVKAKIRPSSSLLSLKADDATAEWSAADNHWDCAACWYVFYSIKAATNKYDRNEFAEWKVNIVLKTVTPGNEKAKKLYELVDQ